MNDPRSILQRHPANPILKPEDYPGIYSMFNPSPVMVGKRTAMLVSLTHFTGRTSQTHVSWSDDGVHFTVEDKPFISIDILEKHGYPYDIVCWNVIDNRITKIGDTYYILTPVSTMKFDSSVTLLGKTRDFKTYELIEIIALPRNRGVSLFSEKIGGKYYRLDRPGAGTGCFGSIWLSSSPDLIHWGCHRPVLPPGYAKWNTTKIGPTPPIKTPQGWLTIVHGVRTPCDGCRYYISAVMLDLEQPWKVVGKMSSYLLYADAIYEANGHVDNVVFPCGAIADEAKDELRLYYGAADSRICLATGKLSDIIEACVKEL